MPPTPLPPAEGSKVEHNSLFSRATSISSRSFSARPARFSFGASHSKPAPPDFRPSPPQGLRFAGAHTEAILLHNVANPEFHISYNISDILFLDSVLGSFGHVSGVGTFTFNSFKSFIMSSCEWWGGRKPLVKRLLQEKSNIRNVRGSSDLLRSNTSIKVSIFCNEYLYMSPFLAPFAPVKCTDRSENRYGILIVSPLLPKNTIFQSAPVADKTSVSFNPINLSCGAVLGLNWYSS